MGMEFNIALLLIAFAPLLEFVRAQEPYGLPNWPTCGELNEYNFFNFTHISGISEHPWMGRLGYEAFRGISYKCLAILITNQHLLAPAHCFDDNERMPVRYVLLGDWNPTNSIVETDCDLQNSCIRLPKLLEIDEIIIHPDYATEQVTNDISIVKLMEPLTHFSSSIRPICLPKTNSPNDPHIGNLLYTSGFALNSSVPHKLKGIVQILGGKQCRRSLVNLKDLSAAIPFDMNHLCGISSNSLPPLIMGSALMGVQVETKELQNYYLIGVLVGGEGTLSKPFIFIRVDSYIQWIRRLVRVTANPTTTTTTAKTLTKRTTTAKPTTRTGTANAKTIRASFEIFPAIDNTEDEPTWT